MLLGVPATSALPSQIWALPELQAQIDDFLAIVHEIHLGKHQSLWILNDGPYLSMT